VSDRLRAIAGPTIGNFSIEGGKIVVLQTNRDLGGHSPIIHRLHDAWYAPAMPAHWGNLRVSRLSAKTSPDQQALAVLVTPNHSVAAR
jgi:hypothetical protein